jgi:putative intracellular protease/amidase
LIFGQYDEVLVDAMIRRLRPSSRKFSWSGQAEISGNRVDVREENTMTTTGKVLVLVSSGHGWPLKDGQVYAGAGYYLNELTVPVRALMKEGYEITFANPKGNTPQMTVFSTAEEQQREPLEIGGKVLFYPDFALRTAGGDVTVLAPWKSYVLQDRELISGQNPFSDEALLKLLLPALNGRRTEAARPS